MAVIGRQRRVFSASMTVEASYVMAVTILAIAVLIRTAYFQCRKTASVMNLHCAVEQLRYREEETYVQLPCGQVKKDSKQIRGCADTGEWEKEITADIFEPEEILRKMAVLEGNEKTEGDTESGSSIFERNAAELPDDPGGGGAGTGL